MSSLRKKRSMPFFRQKRKTRSEDDSVSLKKKMKKRRRRSEDDSVSLIPSMSSSEKRKRKRKRMKKKRRMTRSEDGSVSLILSMLSFEKKRKKIMMKKRRMTRSEDDSVSLILPMSKEKMKAWTPPWNPIPSLPYDLVLSCLARVSRLYYPTLSLVSKRLRSLLASPDLYKARSLLGCTESCLYVGFRRFGKCLWYTLCLKPNRTLTNNTSQNKPSGYALAEVIHRSPPANFWGLVAVGSNIYSIGSDDIYGDTSSTVSILDCKSHTWHEGPSLPLGLLDNSASVLDEKIYVAGYYRVGHCSLKNSFQVFDTKTQIWDTKPIPYTGRSRVSTTSACIDGKFLVRVVNDVFAYNPKEGGRWDMLEECYDMWPHTVPNSSYCVIENVLYHAFQERDKVHGGFRWYDAKRNKWRDLKGLVGLPEFPYNASVTFGDYGGKMAVFWDQRICFVDMSRVWCAVIALERRNSREIWGTVEWFDPVLTLPAGYDFLKVVAATV